MNKLMIATLFAGTALMAGALRAQDNEAKAPGQDGPAMHEAGPADGPEQPEGRCPMMRRHHGEGPMDEGRGPGMRGPEGRGHRREGFRGGPCRDPEALKAAGATDDQIKTLQGFLDEQDLKSVELRAVEEKSQIALQQLERKGATEDELLKAADALSAARAAQFRQAVQTRAHLKGILGEEVMKKLAPPECAFGMGRGPADAGCCAKPGQGAKGPERGHRRGKPAADEAK